MDDDLICVDWYPPSDAKEPIVARQQAGRGLAGVAFVITARLGAQPLLQSPAMNWRARARKARGWSTAPTRDRCRRW